MSDAAPIDPSQQKPAFELITSRQFPDWLAEQRLSIGFTTYQAGKLFLIGLREQGRVSVFERTFNRCLGLWGDGQTLWLSSLYQLWRFENVFEAGQTHEDFDRLYVPQLAYITGDLDIHDLAVEESGRLVFVNTLFGCLATPSQTHSFVPLWRPPFLSKLAAEDRCHLNGLALENGRAKYVTAVSQSDVTDGWRDHRRDGGCVVDVTSNEVIATGLSMPHSPRVYRDKLWLLNSGTGHFGYIDRQTGRFEAVTFCPGYLRGLSFHGDFAVVGLSKQRENRTFSGLALDDNLAQANAEPRCGVHVIDLRSGDIVHWLRIDGIVSELYDVITLPGVRRPQAIGTVTDEIRRVLRVGEPAPL
ncbi:MAG: TIGR03032 family protein [Planctomycetaceae bacterium]|nr:TIGR03032 family protein [Planctomycetaceae bacterium]